MTPRCVRAPPAGLSLEGRELARRRVNVRNGDIAWTSAVGRARPCIWPISNCAKRGSLLSAAAALSGRPRDRRRTEGAERSRNAPWRTVLSRRNHERFATETNRTAADIDPLCLLTVGAQALIARNTTNAERRQPCQENWLSERKALGIDSKRPDAFGVIATSDESDREAAYWSIVWPQPLAGERHV